MRCTHPVRVECGARYGRGQSLSDCSVHCRLAEFRGLMFQVKYGAVLGFIKPSLEIVTGHIQKGAFLGQSQRRI